MLEPVPLVLPVFPVLLPVVPVLPLVEPVLELFPLEVEAPEVSRLLCLGTNSELIAD